MKNLKYCVFGDVDLADKFFDSLKEDYAEFSDWFERKAASQEMAYVFYRAREEIDGFLYLKTEVGVVADVVPPLAYGRHLKVGTLKINAHGTKLGERFIKKILDHAVLDGVDDVYVTVFEKHENLIDLITRYGFERHAEKQGRNGVELVFLRKMKEAQGDVLKDYPYILPDRGNAFLLGIYPQYHTRFLPDSKLHNESFDILKDVSHTNSIHKIFISGVAATGKLSAGDILVMYRTNDGKGKAYYRSVATSICVVEEARKIKSFDTKGEFMRYVKPYSVFDSAELEDYFHNKKRRTIIKFTYNAALTKRIIRGNLMQEIGISSKSRWDFLKLTKEQLYHIVQVGELNENFIIN